MTRACKHEYPGTYLLWRFGGLWIRWNEAVKSGIKWDDYGARRCNQCHAWLPLGPSDETDPRVVIEIDAARRAQEWADENYKPGADRFDWCPEFRDGEDLCVTCHALYGAHCIATHDEHTEGDQ